MVGDSPNLRGVAIDVFQAALRAVDSAAAVRKAVSVKGDRLRFVDSSFELTKTRKIYCVALGKAAFPMASALDEILGPRMEAGVVSGYVPKDMEPHPHARLDPERWKVFAGGHPIPNQFSIFAAESAFDLLERANRKDELIIFLVSGGGSAMMDIPRDGISLDELRAAYQTLVSCGAGIEEINSVRRCLSTVKGGGLADKAPLADHLTLIISDTSHGQEASVASGPTFEFDSAEPDAREVIGRYNLEKSLPQSVIEAVQRYSVRTRRRNLKGTRKYFVLLTNDDALSAAAENARARGFFTEVAADVVEQPIAEGCNELLSRVVTLRQKSSSPCCIISGGEFACPVRGSGAGGRNSETVLRIALEMDHLARESTVRSRFHMMAFSAGTDGIDGNSPPAGAIADQNTVFRALAKGLDPATYLNSSDSFGFFNVLGDALVTGATGSNVRDLRILLCT